MSTNSTGSWIAFWDGEPPIYAGPQHKAVHYEGIADGIARYLPRAQARVLDYGCGEALFASRIAAKCERVYLTDAAPSVADALATRFAEATNIEVVAHDRLDDEIEAASLDLVVVNSVAQYLSEDEFSALVERLKPLLAPSGVVLFADIIPPDVGMVRDTSALLSLAIRNGFFIQAAVGLVRTYFSNYRQLRNRLGLKMYEESAFIERLRNLGFDCRRVRPNLGHNQNRMAFEATPIAGPPG